MPTATVVVGKDVRGIVVVVDDAFLEELQSEIHEIGGQLIALVAVGGAPVDLVECGQRKVDGDEPSCVEEAMLALLDVAHGGCGADALLHSCKAFS